MDVLDIKELAQYLNCSISSVRKLVRDNQIPYFRICSKICFSKEQINTWIHDKTIKCEVILWNQIEKEKIKCIS